MNAHPYDLKLERLLDLCDELHQLYGGFVAVRILVDEPPYAAGRDLSDNPRLYSAQFMPKTEPVTGVEHSLWTLAADKGFKP